MAGLRHRFQGELFYFPTHSIDPTGRFSFPPTPRRSQMKQYISVMAMLVLLAFATTATARIGETLAQCQTRYGKEIRTTDGLSIFIKAGFYIMVQFYEGKVDSILFRKVEQNILGIPVEISPNEVQNLLKQNGGGQVWKETNEIIIGSSWATEDGNVLAGYRAMDRNLCIFTLDNTLRTLAKKKAKEDRKLEGF
jgi:hypothetical protein